MEDDAVFLRALEQTERRMLAERAAAGQQPPVQSHEQVKKRRMDGAFEEGHLAPGPLLRPASAPAAMERSALAATSPVPQQHPPQTPAALPMLLRAAGSPDGVPAFCNNTPVLLSIWDRHRFAVGRNYPPQLTEFLRSFPFAVFDKPAGCFHYPLKQYTTMVAALRQMRFTTIAEPPRGVLDTFLGAPKPLAVMEPDRIPADLMGDMFPFQRSGVEFVVARNGKALIADEMGLGKTIQGIAVAAYFRADWPLLIVCPSSLRITWGQQIEKWLSREAAGVNIVMQRKGANLDAPINIVSFALAALLGDDLTKRAYQTIIVDESHYLKNMRAKRSQALLPLLQRARHAVLLSGTPALSRPSELFPQLNCLAPLLFPHFPAFGTRYCNARQMPWGMDYSGSSNSKELNAVLTTLMIRRKKDDVLDQLPAKTRQKVLLHVDQKSLKALRKHMDDMSVAADVMHSADTRSAAGQAASLKQRVFFQLFQDVGRAKLPAVIEYVLEQMGDEEATGPKFLVFAHHKDVIAGLCNALSESKKDFICIDGSTPGNHRQKLVDHFQTHPACRVAVLSIMAAGVGLTLTAASFVLFAELYYNPGAIMQAEDRAHRIGQQNRVWVHYLVARNTVDEQIFRLLNRKISILGETLDGVTGKQLDLAQGSQAEIHREQLNSISDDSFVNQLLRMVQRGADEDDDDDMGDGDDGDGHGDAIHYAAGDAVESAPVEALDADAALASVREKKSTAASKFASFAFPGAAGGL